MQIKSQLAFDSAHRLMSGLLAFFSPMPKEAQRKQRPASSPAVHARFPEPKEARNLKRKGSTLQLRAATEKKKDNRGGAGRGQGRKKGSLGKRKKEAQQKEKLAAASKGHSKIKINSNRHRDNHRHQSHSHSHSHSHSPNVSQNQNQDQNLNQRQDQRANQTAMKLNIAVCWWRLLSSENKKQKKRNRTTTTTVTKATTICPCPPCERGWASKRQTENELACVCGRMHTYVYHACTYIYTRTCAYMYMVRLGHIKKASISEQQHRRESRGSRATLLFCSTDCNPKKAKSLLAHA